MKRLILIPILFITSLAFSQVDTVLGYKGKLIKDTAVSIAGNYLYFPSRNVLSFDSTKLAWQLNGNKVYYKNGYVGIGLSTPRARLMISDSVGATSTNDSTGLELTNDTTALSPPLVFNAKALNTVSNVWQNSRMMINSSAGSGNPINSVLHIRYSINGAAYGSDILTLTPGATGLSLQGAVSAGGNGSSFGTSVTTTQLFATYLTLGNFLGGFAITENGSVSGAATEGGFNIAPSISIASLTPSTFKGVYFNPSITTAPNATIIGYQNEVGSNLLNTTSDNTGIGVSSIDHNAKLQVQSTAQGVMFPVMTQSQRDSLARPITSVTVTSGGSGYAASTSTGIVTFSIGAIRAKGQYVTNSSGVITSVTITEAGAYGAGQTPVTCSVSGTAVLTPVLGASAPSTGLTVFCSNCTATDSSTGVYQTWNGSTWKNWW